MEPKYGQASGPIWMYQVNCTGNEKKLTDCKFPGWGCKDCSHDDDVAVKCFSKKMEDGERLIIASQTAYF